MTNLEITDIQRGCTHDGPGLRTTVFFKGCPLNCKWCHNPETKHLKKEIFYRAEKCMGCLRCVTVCPVQAHTERDGTHYFDPAKCTGCMKCCSADLCPTHAIEATSETMTIEEIMEQVLLDRTFYRKRGGLTVSGGEPTFQREGLFALLEAAKAENIHTCIETCGVFPQEIIPRLASCVDLFLYDIKDTDAARLKENTCAALEQVMTNLLLLDQNGSATVLRCVLIPEVNLNAEHALAVAELFQQLNHCLYVELLPYHPYGLSKTEQLGGEGIRYRQPENEELLSFARHLTEKNIPVKLFGTLYEQP